MRWAGRVVRMGKRRVAYGVWWRSLVKEDHLKDLNVDGGIILKLVFEKSSLDWIDSAEERDRWLVLVNAVMNFWIP